MDQRFTIGDELSTATQRFECDVRQVQNFESNIILQKLCVLS